MNRTTLFLGAALLLALAALVLRPAPAQPPPATYAAVPPSPAAAPPVTAPPPSPGAVQLEARLAHPYFPVGTSEAYAVLDIQAPLAAPSPERAPVRIALAIDRSGSMQGEKLEHAKRAARHLLSLLTERDQLAIVHYGSDVRRLPELRVTPSNRERMAAFIDSIHDEGTTNLSGGLEAAVAELATPVEGVRSRRLILLSDGEPTEGLTREADLFTLASRIREQGVAVSAIGIGVDFNASLMQGLAQRGGGFYAYLRDASALADIFSRELLQATQAVARNPELSLSLPAGVRVEEVLGVPWSAADNGSVRVPLYDLSAGSSARVVVKLSVTSSVPAEHVPVATVALRYLDPRTGDAREAQARLEGVATEQRAEVDAHADSAALAATHRALGAKQLAAAAEAFRQGDRASGFAFLDNVRSLFGASAEALAGDIHELDATRAALSRSSNPDDFQDQSKRLYRKSLSGFGQNNSY